MPVADPPPDDEAFLGDTVTPGQLVSDADVDSLHTTHASGKRTAVGRPGPTLEKGEPVDRYVVLDQLGVGGMGEVYSAWDPVLDRKVALKLLKAEHQAAGKLADELRIRLMREAQALARVTHPSVVTVHDVGIVDDQIYLAMEFVEGRTLTQWLAERPRGWREIVDTFLEAGEGLAAAHEAGVTHRDFKPDNVIISQSGRARVMDFGLAHAHDSTTERPPRDESVPGAIERRITSPGVMLGTPAYMSPEALYGKETDPRSDEFSFAVALYEALYGHRPFEGATAFAVAAEIEQHKVRPPPRGTRVPRRVHELLVRALRAKADERFPTLRELLVQLGVRKRSRQRQVVTALIAGLSVLALLAVIGLWQRERQRCAGMAGRLAGIWDEPVRVTSRAAFERTNAPWATSSWLETERLMNEWSTRWVTARTAACKATDGRPDEQLGETIVCLSRRLADFDATAQLLRNADLEIAERGPLLASALPALSVCDLVTPSRRPDTATLSAPLARARALIDTGKLVDAERVLDALAPQAREARDDRALAEATWLKARLAAARLDHAAAEQHAERAALLALSLGVDEVAARAWIDRVGFASMASDPQSAARWVPYARASVDRLGAPRELEASLSNNEAVLASRVGRHADALALHRRALSLRESVFGPRSELAARSHSNIGVALRALGRAADAIEAFRVALAIEEQVLAPEHPAVADTLNNLANALHDTGADAEAAQLLERSLAIRERAYGPASSKVAQSLSNLGAVLVELGRANDAVTVLQRALAIREASAGSDGLSLAPTLTNLATAQRRAGSLQAAIAADTRALEIREAKLGPKSAELTRNLVGLAASKLATPDLAGARPLLERALLVAPAGSIERGDALLLFVQTLGAADPRRRALLEEALQAWPASYGSRAEAEQLLRSAKP